MQKFLILQLRPEDETSDNEFAAFLQRGELQRAEVERIRIEKNGIPEIDLAHYKAIIVGGSPFDISTPEREKSAIQKTIEADFMRLFHLVLEADFPFLGACSGNGLLGHYLNACITQKYAESVGGVDITLTDAGKEDPLCEGFPPVFRAMVGHKEACDFVPEGATLLASSDTCPVQMFRVGKNIYAMQFHPEADASVFITRIEAYKNHGYFPASEAQKTIDAVKKENAPIPHKMLKRFVARYR